MSLAIGFSSWTVYNTACFLIEGMGGLDAQRQQQFNATLFQYLLIFSIIGIVAGSFFHFYFTKKLLKPVKKLIQSTKELKAGQYPEPIAVQSEDEVGELIYQYNHLVQELKRNEEHREKLVSDLSHEFRTPLANLNGYLQALRTGVIVGDKELYESLYKESNRLAEMIEQLDQLKRWDYVHSQTRVESQFVHIADEIYQCAAMFHWTLTEENIPLQIQVENKEMSIQVEGIQQVISNLLDNAIQYYQGTGPIILRGERLKSAYRISVTGPGKTIPLEERDRLFERFYRVERSRSRETGGSGLGLAIAKEIVERHDGKITVEETDAGNCFSFTLPTDERDLE